MFGRGGSLLDRLCSYGELGMGSNVIRKSSQRNQNAGPVVSKCEAVGVGFGVVEADARQALTRVFYARGALVWDDRTWGELLMRWSRSFSLMALRLRAEAESRYRGCVVCRAQIGFLAAAREIQNPRLPCSHLATEGFISASSWRIGGFEQR